MTEIERISGEGFLSIIELHVEASKERVVFKGDGDIDADGANGQNGSKAAYTIRDDGSELLANGGMKLWGNPRRVIAAQSWAKDIVILNPGGSIRVFEGGIVASKTAYRFPDFKADDPRAYLDSETVSYTVVPGSVIQAGTKGAVMGCLSRVTNLVNGKVSIGVVGDVGPRKKIGEISIQMARELGVNPSPRTGGTNAVILKYELWPGQFGKVAGKIIPLQTSRGTYIRAV
jgi:hypothetical protein